MIYNKLIIYVTMTINYVAAINNRIAALRGCLKSVVNARRRIVSRLFYKAW